MNNKQNRDNRIFNAQGTTRSAVLFVVGDNEMKDNTIRRNIFGRAHTMILTLLMALTMTATAVSGITAYAANDTVHVATYDQLQEALENTQGVKEIVIDPQAAVEEGEVVYSVEGDENSDAFYIGFDEPLTVSHDITITSADDVDVYFARSDSFRRDQGKPALLNIDSTGNLNLDGLITMTGEEVTTTFYEADEEKPAELVFSVKSKDGTGEDNEVWNRGQALKGGFYIQNNGGEYTLGDDVIMEDINLADDVEDVEQIHEVEKTTLRSLFSSNKSEEEATTEESAESTDEATTEEKATQEEEVVVAPTPKRMMKNALMGTTPTSSENTSDQAVSLGDGEWEVSSWRQLHGLFERPASDTYIKTVYIKNDIVATPIEGENDPVDNPVVKDKKYKAILLGGRKGVTIRGPQTGEPVHIYRDASDGNFPLFVVQNDNNELTLGEKLILSGKTYACAKTLDEFAQTTGSGSDGTGTLTFTNGKLLAVKRSDTWYLLSSKSLNATDTVTKDTFDISTGYLKANLGEVNHFADAESNGNYIFHSSLSASSTKTLQVGYLDEENGTFTRLTSKPTSGTTLYIYDPNNEGILGLDQTGGIAAYDLGTGFNTENAIQLTYTEGGKSWVIDDVTYTKESDAIDALNALNDKLGLPRQGCDSKEKIWTAEDFTGGSNINDAKAFFVNVRNSGTLNINGAVMEDFTTDATVKNAAPVVVSNKAAFEMSDGEIRNNKVGYGAKEDENMNNNDSQSTVQRLGQLIRDTEPTNTAGGVIFTGSETTGKFTGKAKILENRADAGALIVTDEAKVTMENSSKDADEKYELEFKGNIGWHHSGAVLVEDGATFTLNDGSINNNVAWWKGGAVWATEYGTNGLVQWKEKQYPNAMKDNVTKHTDSEGKPNGGNFIMNGGELDNNFAFARGGAVEVESDGVQLLGGTISNNKCKSLGGGIYVEGDSPIYSYTLTIRNGYIGNNTSVAAVPNDNLDKKIVNGKLVDGSDYNEGGNKRWHMDGDWANWGKQHTGDGGGVWLCAMGGTSIFTSNSETEEEVIIDNNHAARVDGDNNGFGDDFYISHRHGSALVQNMTGTWKKDNNGNLPINPQTGGVLRGPLGMENKGKPNNGGNYSEDDATGIKIIGNIGRNGGGLAVNGTVIMGKPANVYRYQSEFNLEKIWEGVTQREVTLRMYYKYDVNNDGTIDPETELFELVQEDTNEKYEVKFGTNEGIIENPTGNEFIYKYDVNKAKATVPVTTKHTNGAVVQLYQIYNQQSENIKINSENSNEFIDVNNQEDLEALFKFINNRPDVKLNIKWNIVIKEDGDEFVMTPGDVTAQGNTSAGEEIDLINPDNKEKLDSIKVFFDTVKFGQTLTNTPKSTSAEFTKVDGTNAIEGKTATFKLYEAVKNDPNKQWYNWVPVANSARDLSLNTENGKLSIDNLVYGKTYMLFETQAPAGYIREIDPWFIFVDNNGNVSVSVLEDGYKNKYYDPTQTSNPNTNDGYDYTENLDNKEWPNKRLTTKSTVLNLKNEPFDIKLNKVKENGKALDGAKFDIYRVDRTSKGYYELKGSNRTKLNANDIVSNDGEISLPEITSEGYYILFEKEAPVGFERAVEPWLLNVDKYGKCEVYEYKNDAGNQWVRGGSDNAVSIPTTYAEVANDIASTTNTWKGWKTGWYDGNTVSEGKLVNKWSDMELIKHSTGNENNLLMGAKFQLIKLSDLQIANADSPVTPALVEGSGNEGSSNEGSSNNGNSNSGTSNDTSVKTPLVKMTSADLKNGQKVFLVDPQVGKEKLFSVSDDEDAATYVSSISPSDYHNSTETLTAETFTLQEHTVNGQKVYSFLSESGKYLSVEVGGTSYISSLGDVRSNDSLQSGHYSKWDQDTNSRMVRTSYFKISINRGNYDIRAYWYKDASESKDYQLFVRNEYGGNHRLRAEENLFVGVSTRVPALYKESGETATTEPGTGTSDPGTGSSEQSNYVTYELTESNTNPGHYYVDHLADGFYKLIETEAPDNYDLIPDENGHHMIIRVLDGEFDIVEGSDPRLSVNENNKFQLKLANDELTTINAQKKWYDKNGNEKTAPSNITSVTFHLWANRNGNRELIESRTVQGSSNAANNWKTTFTDLPKFFYHADGTRDTIDYYIVEGTVTGYTPTYEFDSSTNTIIVKNHETKGGTVNLTIDKEWTLNGEPNSLKKEVTVQIWSNITDENEKTPVGDPIKLNSGNGWTATVRDLPLYAQDGSGRKVRYWVTEDGIDGFKDIGYVEAVEGQNNAQATGTYKAYTKVNEYLKNRTPTAKIAWYEYFVEKPNNAGTEQVFCLNWNATNPTERTTASSTGYTEYTKEEITAEQLLSHMSSGNYGGYVRDADKLKTKVMKSVYMGLGSDGAGLFKSTAINENTHKMAHLTQYAIYEYTNFYFAESSYNYGYDNIDYVKYGSYNKYNYRSKTTPSEEYDGYGSGYYYYTWAGPHGLTKYPRFDTAGLHWRVDNNLANSYKELMNRIEDSNTDDVIKDFKLYVYKPKNKPKTGEYQYLLGVEAVSVNMYAHLVNEVEYDEVTIYKHEANKLDTAVNGVKFRLYEEIPTGSTVPNGAKEFTVDGVKVGDTTKKFKVKNDYTTGSAINPDGKVKISNLLAGRYYVLEEVETVNGYIKLAKPIVFKLTNTNDKATQIVYWDESASDNPKEIVLYTEGENGALLNVANKPVYDLPSAGGMGTYWFMVIGTMMMTFAVTTLIIRKKGTGKL